MINQFFLKKSFYLKKKIILNSVLCKFLKYYEKIFKFLTFFFINLLVIANIFKYCYPNIIDLQGE